ncbi:MAG: gamma-glutamylcyclotransferase family protein [Cyclobacteriaceae bacterium]
MSGQIKEYLFAYGLLKTEYRSNPKYQVPHMNVTFVSSGTLSGKLYHISHYPGFVFDEASPKVYGEIFQINDPDFFTDMDEYECAKPLYKGSHEYVRRKRKVETTDHHFVECWVYEYDKPIEGLEIIINGNFSPTTQS